MPLAPLKPFNAASLDGVFVVFFGSPLKGFFTLRKCHFLNAFGANAQELTPNWGGGELGGGDSESPLGAIVTRDTSHPSWWRRVGVAMRGGGVCCVELMCGRFWLSVLVVCFGYLFCPF